MLSKREKLLIRPWQQRKYENHRKKVQSALPVIDNKPPPLRQHVLCKYKKHQKEIERCAKIEKDNLTLLRKLSYTMRTNRVDNFWSTPQPNFLNKVPIYEYLPRDELVIFQEVEPDRKASGRKSRCVACTPQPQIDILVPEERIPWEPEKPPVSRLRSKSVPARRSSLLPTINERDIPKTAGPRLTSGTRFVVRAKSSSITPPSAKRSDSSAKRFDRSKLLEKSEQQNFSTDRHDCLKSPQSVILSRGCLKLAVNFPSDTLVKLQNGNTEKLLFGSNCFCRNTVKVC